MGHKTVNREQRKGEQGTETRYWEQGTGTENKEQEPTWKIEHRIWNTERGKINRKDGTNREQGARNSELKTGN
jgi:hypothetical protein